MKNNLSIRITIGIIIACLGSFLSMASFSEKVDLIFFDMLQKHALPHKEPSTIIVALDQGTYEVLGWPISRALYAELINIIHKSGAKRIGFDLFFTDRQESMNIDREGGNEEVLEAEKSLGEAAKNSATVLASYIIERGSDNKEPPTPTPSGSLFDCGENKNGQMYAKALLSGISRQNPLIGHVHSIPSSTDGVYRKIKPCFPVFDGCIKDLASSMTGINLDPKNCTEPVFIPFFKSYKNFPQISMVEILDVSGTEAGMKRLKELFKDKYVLIGTTDETLKDVGPTPMATSEPLVMTHANRIEGIISGISIKEISQWHLSAISIALLLFTLLFVSSGRMLLMCGLGFIAIAVGATALLFKINYFYLPVMSMIFPYTIGVLSVAGFVGWKVFLFNQTLSTAFDTYVSPEILSWLKETGGKVLQPDSAERREITIMFSDIAGYTSLSNSLDADRIMKSLRLYLDNMLVIAQKYNGYIDKINGDGLMILFGAPRKSANHADEAVNAAISMQIKVAEMLSEWRSITDRGLNIRIGCATGNVFVGNLGGTGHIEYSSIGRDVNLAARLESGSEISGILISGPCYEKLTHKPLGWWRKVHLKGYEDLVDVFQIPPQDMNLAPFIEDGDGEVLLSKESYDSLKEKPEGEWIETRFKAGSGMVSVFKVSKEKINKIADHGSAGD